MRQRAIWKCLAMSVLALAMGASHAAAADYPARQIRLVVPFTPGGGTDIMARVIAAEMTKNTGQTVVVENKPGAGGIIGTEYVARASPDGYTLMIGSVSTISINPSLYTKMSVNPLEDLMPAGAISSTPSIFAVPADLDVSTLQEFIEYAKSRPGSINYGSAGVGTSHHLAGELFKMQTGVHAQHIAYKGSSPAALSLMRGESQFLIANIPSLQAALDGDRIKPLAVTSLNRAKQFPDLPTVVESGLPEFEVVVWYGMFAPKNTPEEVVGRINEEIRKAVSSPTVQKQLITEGAEPMVATLAEFEQIIMRDYEKWKRVIEASGIQLE
ncbi:tripartite tricarboxylate transporter substrate binding protein [Alcaligenaceae bacterium]|nr:tripartite tricarboxylate transporter substrate binding protein [Alcaligenaceae bacterium]